MSRQRLIIILLQVMSMQLLITEKVVGQSLMSTKVSAKIKEKRIEEIFKIIEDKTDFVFVFPSEVKDEDDTYSFNFADENMENVLRRLRQAAHLKFQVIDYTITAAPDASLAVAAQSPTKEVRATITVSGTITDGIDNAKLPGVSILVKGSSYGTSCDGYGNYTIEVPDQNSILTFSFIGYQSRDITVGTQTVIDVALKPDVTSLQEIIVVGYGTQKKNDLTGSVGTVKSEDIRERQLPTVSQALAGRVPGVNVSINSGRPGGQSNVRIRGFSSISTSNNPLYVVDGVIMPVGSQTDGSYLLNNAIDNINPADIASIEILKDASAAAIYGARGANGVILITTKRGSTTGTKVSYDMQFSVPTIGPNRVEMLNSQQFLDTEQLGWDNIKYYDAAGWNPTGGPNGTGSHSSGRQDPQDARKALTNIGVYSLFDADGKPLYDTDWLKESTQNKLSQNHQLALTGGNADNSYGVFLGFRGDNGLLLNSYLKRYSGRFVMDSQVKSWLKMGGSLAYNYQEENIVDYGTGGLNSVRMITEALPILPVRYPNGVFSHNKNYSASIEGGRNPVDQMLNNSYVLISRTTLGNMYANIRLAEGLELRSTVGLNILERERQRYDSRPAPQTPTYVTSPNERGTARLRSERETFWSFENYLTYNKRFGSLHSLTAMLGQSAQETNIFWFQQSSRNFISDFFEVNNMGAAQDFAVDSPPIGSGRVRYAFSSYFSRVNYGLMDKYLLTVTGRFDGSSKFGDANKYAFFPSAAVAWRISEEPFLKGNRLISNLKLRTSYGLTGNSEIAAYSALPTLRIVTAVFGNTRQTGVATNRLGNPDLKWERTAQSDIGLEVGLFDNQIAIEADVYYRKTTDMLLAAPLPVTSGYGTITRNVGSMENKGIELAITTQNVETVDFSWRTTFNMAMNRNKVLKLANPAPIFGVGNPNFTNQTGVIMEGQPVGAFWGLVRQGTWGSDEAAEAAKFGTNTYRGTGKPLLPGDVKYLDVDGNYAINDNDRMIIGNGNPKSYGSFINNWQYKAFNIVLDISYSYGNDVLNMTMHSAEDRTGLANSYASVLNAWTEANEDTDIAAIRDSKAGYVSNVDTHWIEDGSFIRGRNLLVGYTLPTQLIERIHLNRAQVYVSLQNFFLETKFSGNDPEVSTYTNPFAQGQTFFDYPKPTTYMLGLSIGL
ncbi:SusC/RagA family TonB-linked outer membrane protein [Chryseolinea sp. T2]|uniref:SusC/RagA family TonB-linked outer membrane protein n=1 Tax=Chryseolinea sp. T2 TaxID=3129255 RepID=UPI0030788047